MWDVESTPYELLDSIYEAVYTSTIARKDRQLCQEIVRNLELLKWSIDSLYTQLATANREAAEATNETELIGIRLEDIAYTFQAMQTGFRDMSDLRQAILTA